MNVRKPRSGAQGLSLRDRLTEWRELLDGCERKPTRKRVHALRVVTLRIQSELEQELGGIPHASHEARAILRFGKQGERLRGALGTVREIDVWIGDLKGLRESMMETTGTAESYVPRTSRECVRGIERLEARLEKKRHTAEKKLIAEIGRRRGNLESAARRLADEWPDHQSEADPQAYERILIRFADIAKEYAVLSEENLHDFRKQIKTVRYLAEMSEGDPRCGWIAVQVQKLQASIGEWHDWQSLARTVRRHKKNASLGELLDNLASEALAAALELCQRVIAQLLGERSVERPGRKPPLRSDASGSMDLGKRLA